jgi:hypothetical protein
MGSFGGNPWMAALTLLVKYEFSSTLGNNDYDVSSNHRFSVVHWT